MKVLVVDDEMPARARLRRMLEGMDGCSVCGEAADGREALLQCEQLQPDVLLLDIRMPSMDGLEAARHLLALERPPAVIFTTAYSEHALAAFETHAVDYLLKPVRQERLAQALENTRRLTRVQAAALQAADADGGVRKRICARVRGSLQLIPVEEIRYFLADQKYVTIGTAESRVLIEESLKSLEEEFAERFVRIHRNALVAPVYLIGLERDADGQFRARLRDVGETLEISRRHLAEVRRLIKFPRS
jgi:two-component system, LytTR family, response regulator AlgR